ncbi:MAG: response regulator [bacterium]
MDNKPVKILLIEDNPGDARLIREMLREVKNFPFDLVWVDRLSSGLDCLARERVGIVLLDLSLPDSHGLATFERVAFQAPDVPVIILTILADEMTAMKAVEKGAQDYLFKGQVDGHLLVHSIRYAIGRRQVEEALRITHRFLEITNRHTKMNPLLQECIAEIRKFTGCEAVGIRILDEEGNIPYQACDGFEKDFYQAEDPLSIKSGQCMCIRVMKGETNSRISWCTEAGSFFTNHMSRFLAAPSEEEEKGGETCKVRQQTGYESTALVPIRLGESTLGVIHVADQRENMLPLKTVTMLEKVALQLGEAIQRVRLEEIRTENERALRESEERYRQRLVKLVKERTSQLTAANEQLRQEIAERQQAEERTMLAYAELNQIFKAAVDGICVISKDFKVLRFNEAFCSLFGLNRDEAIGKTCHEVLHHPLCHTPNCPLAMIHKGMECFESDLQIEPREEGLKTSCILTAIPFKSPGGELIGIVENFKDITERKRMEEEVQKAQRLESLGLLTGGIAHDFNNILSSIIGSFSLLKLHAKQGEKFFDWLTRAEKAAFAARDLTQQLLAFSRGVQEPVKKIISLPEILEEAMSFSLVGSKVQSEFLMPDNLWPVEADKGQIRQVINNLTINAIEAMPQGGNLRVWAENVTIEAHESLPLAEGRYVKISVQDQGVGIPAEHLQKIFDPYFTTKETGTGLGLATSYSIIKKHGGYITAESEAGAGTTFHLFLPASEKELFAVKNVVEEDFSTGRGKILFMDDQKTIRDMVGDMLMDLGYEVTLAKEGSEAVQLYEQAKVSGRGFDAVILDLTVPGGLGAQFAVQKLREMDPGVKAIVSSGYSNDPVISAYQDYGFCGGIAKPYEIKELARVISSVLKGKQGPCLKEPQNQDSSKVKYR